MEDIKQKVTVIAKCPAKGCKVKKEYDESLNYIPHCSVHFFVPMIISKVKIKNL